MQLLRRNPGAQDSKTSLPFRIWRNRIIMKHLTSQLTTRAASMKSRNEQGRVQQDPDGKSYLQVVRESLDETGSHRTAGVLYGCFV